MIAKSEQDFDGLRKAGQILSSVLRDLAFMVAPGVTTAQLDLRAEELIRAAGAVPAFLNYKPTGARYPYPAVLCVFSCLTASSLSIHGEMVSSFPHLNNFRNPTPKIPRHQLPEPRLCLRNVLHGLL
jgi:hypothetical protein